MEHPPENATPIYLNGWKEIANYLGKGVRTVQRHERQLGLPVRRPAGKGRSAVLATKAEIDAWVKASSLHCAFPLTQLPKDPREVVPIKGSVAEMHQLREQMAALRAELRAAVHQLETTVVGLQRHVHPEQRQEPFLKPKSN